ncbi:Protein UXT [Microtus ochrogaster]|uniref:Protein UXT n=1 Tax=Microtus ochrogaster TaxID=79684 RepID=A0A8J6G0H4_MICOH|nr:Protein UXT [Microtus ochrogaster]
MEPPPPGAAAATAAPHAGEPQVHKVEGAVHDPMDPRPGAWDVAWPRLLLFGSTVKVLDHRDKVYEQLSVYLQLRNVIERLQETNHSELYMQVDLGCNFFVDTVVPDTSRIYVALGYGFFLELTLAEALKFIDRKSSLLTEYLWNGLSTSLVMDPSVTLWQFLLQLLREQGNGHIISWTSRDGGEFSWWMQRRWPAAQEQDQNELRQAQPGIAVLL